MKKVLLLFCYSFLIGSTNIQAQTIGIPNRSFESWINLQGLIDVPDSWPSSDLIWFSKGLNTHNVYRDFHNHSGKYSARIGPDTSSKKIWPGFIAAKFAINQRAKYFSLYYVDSMNKAESGVVKITLFKGKAISQDSIGGAVWNFPDSIVPDFNFAQIPLEYSGSDTTLLPDSISVTIEVVSSGTALKSGFVAVDDVALSVKKLAVLDIQDPETVFRIFPNPSNGLVQVITYNPVIYSSNIYVSDITGKLIFPKYLSIQNQTTIDFSDSPAGLYFIKLLSGDNVSVRKLIIYH